MFVQFCHFVSFGLPDMIYFNVARIRNFLQNYKKYPLQVFRQRRYKKVIIKF
jgi:hypothetical protein